jgi:hypothetical protein
MNTALDHLNQLIVDMNYGIEKCRERRKGVTTNEGLMDILHILQAQVKDAIIEIHKGNVK